MDAEVDVELLIRNIPEIVSGFKASDKNDQVLIFIRPDILIHLA